MSFTVVFVAYEVSAAVIVVILTIALAFATLAIIAFATRTARTIVGMSVLIIGRASILARRV